MIRCISLESFSISPLFPIYSFVTLKTFLELLEVFWKVPNVFFLSYFSWIAATTSKENWNENLLKSISGIFGKKFMGTHCNALLSTLNLLSFSRTGTVKVWVEGIENNLQRKLINAPCLQSKDVNWIEVGPNLQRRNLNFCLCLHNCRPFCYTFFQYSLQRASPSNALPCSRSTGELYPSPFFMAYLWYQYTQI
jgi:hypothetical protein